MRNSSKILKRAIVAANQTLQSLFDLDAQVAKAADLIEESLRAGNKLLVCGNGGSAADASHFATEFVVRFTKDRPASKAHKLKTIAFLGRDGGSTIGMADVDLLVRSDSTARIQEAHQLLLHVLCETIESRLAKNRL